MKSKFSLAVVIFLFFSLSSCNFLPKDKKAFVTDLIEDRVIEEIDRYGFKTVTKLELNQFSYGYWDTPSTYAFYFPIESGKSYHLTYSAPRGDVFGMLFKYDKAAKEDDFDYYSSKYSITSGSYEVVKGDDDSFFAVISVWARESGSYSIKVSD